MAGGISRSFIGGLAAASLVLPGVAISQQEDGGRSLKLRFGTTVRTDDNYTLAVNSPGRSSFVTHTLGLDFRSETRSQKLAFGLSGLVRYGTLPGTTTATGFDEPAAYLDYTLSGAASSLTLGGNYREQRVSFLTALDDTDGVTEDFDPRDLTTGRGTLAQSDLRSTLSLGTDAPLGLDLTLTHVARDYRNTTSADLYDSETNFAEAVVRLRFSPTLTGRVTASLRDYSAEDAPNTDRETRRIGLSLTGEMSEALSFTAALGHNRIETTETLGGTRTARVNSGLSGRLGLTRKLANGSASVQLANTFSTNGNRYSLTFSRAMELPRGGLDLSFGATRQDGNGRTFLIGSLDYTHVLDDSRLSASLSRSIQTSSAEDVLEVTSARLGYLYQVNEVSNINLTLSHVDSAGVGATTVADRTRTNLRVTYSRQLERDWALSAGVEHRRLDIDGTGRARANGVFLSLDKTFSLWR